MAGASALGGAGVVLAAEVCAPLLLLCWLCCWPDDASDTSSGKRPPKPVITNESGSHRRSHELFGRRFASSAVSLHLPSTSGSTKQPISAHKSHEDIRSRRKSQLETSENDARYHSAPSVIDEVLHRRDWERSTKELYIPLKPDGDSISFTKTITPDTDEPEETVHQHDDHIIARSCKKHYANIKSSHKKNAEATDDIKDYDATETESSFYVGENVPVITEDDHENSKVYKPKETKQSLNESIKSKEKKKQILVPVEEFKVSRFDDANVVEIDRSGAIHHSVESRSSLYNAHGVPVPPPSVEVIGYESDASYLEEETWAQAPGVPNSWDREEVTFIRARHASAGDVLAPVLRPQSGALSESDLDFDLEACDEVPPAYHEVRLSMDRKETAI